MRKSFFKKIILLAIFVIAPFVSFVSDVHAVAAGNNCLPGVNPPYITQVSMGVGNPPQTLFVDGTDFNQFSIISFNGDIVGTNRISAGQLSASITTPVIPGIFYPVQVYNGQGDSEACFSNVVPIYVAPPVNNPTPTISDVSPNSAVGGSQSVPVLITGTNFIPSTVAKVNGAPVPTVINSANQLIATIPAASLVNSTANPITLNISVTNPTNLNSGVLPFIVTANNVGNNIAPTITTITPSTVGINSVNVGIGISGSDFLPGASVQIGSTVILSADFWSFAPNYIGVNVPNSVFTTAGVLSIKVINPGPPADPTLRTSNGVNLTVSAAVNPAPVITSVTPNSVNLNSSATLITIAGTGFVSGITSLSFGGNILPISSITSTQIQATIPAGWLTVAGNYSVSVYNAAPGGGGSSATFVVNSLTPTITTVNNSSTSPLTVTRTPGMTLVVRGTNFTPQSTVLVTSTSGFSENVGNPHLSYNGPTQLTINSTALFLSAAGTYTLRVQNPLAPPSNAFSVILVNPPAVGNIIVNQNTTPAGVAQSFSFIVTGAGYNNFSLKDTDPPNNQSLNAGVYSVMQGALSNWDTATINCLDGSSYINPASINLVAGHTVNCTFTNQQKGTIRVQKTTNPANYNAQDFTVNAVNTATGISTTGLVNGNTGTNIVDILVPAGTYNVTDSLSGWTNTRSCLNVVVSVGQTTATCQLHNVQDALLPRITSISPPSATKGASPDVFINGTGFVTGPTSSLLRIGALTLMAGPNPTDDYFVVSSTQIRLNAAYINNLLAVGTHSLTVANQNFGGTSNAVNFTLNPVVIPMPTITSITNTNTGVNNRVYVNQLTTVTINGTGFIPSTRVKFGANFSTYNPQIVSSTQITLLISNAEIATIGTRSITIYNPQVVGGITSSPLTLEIIAIPAPTINTNGLVPNSALVGSGPVTVDVYGTNFISGAYFMLSSGGVNIPSGYLTSYATPFDSTHLILTINASVLTTARTLSVVVITPGGTSNAVPFYVNNPVPNITNINFPGPPVALPAMTVAAAPGPLVITGTNFLLPATGGLAFISIPLAPIYLTYTSTATQVTVSAAELNTLPQGNFIVTITNPAPGGGSANAPQNLAVNSNQGTIIINEISNPQSPQNFDYTSNFGVGNTPLPFSLDDDFEPTLPNNRTFTVLAGNYTIAQNMPAGWVAGAIACSDGSLINNIGLSAGETVICTFNNTKLGSITVVKNLSPGNDPGRFNLSVALAPVGNPVTVNNIGNGGTVTSNLLAVGNYMVSETAVTGTLLSDYTTSITCGINQINGTSITIPLAAGEDRVCTITNTRNVIQPPNITGISPTTAVVGSNSFYLDVYSATGQSFISGARISINGTLVPVGDTTFINSGYLRLANQWVPNTVGSFIISAANPGSAISSTSRTLTINKATPTISITPSAGGVIGTVLSNTAAVSGGYLPTGGVTFTLFNPSDSNCIGAGVYSYFDPSAPYATIAPGFVTNAVGTWRWKVVYSGDANNNSATILCTNPTAQVAITAAPVTGRIIIDKNTIPANDPTVFDFTRNYGSGVAFTLKDNDAPNDVVVPQGNYTVSENQEVGWTRTSAVCDGGNTVNNIAITAAGNTVTCTFTNTKLQITSLTAEGTGALYDEKIVGVNGPNLVINGTGFIPGVTMVQSGGFALANSSYTVNSPTKITVFAVDNTLGGGINTYPTGIYSFAVVNPGPYFGTSNVIPFSVSLPNNTGYLRIIQTSKEALGVFSIDTQFMSTSAPIDQMQITTVNSNGLAGPLLEGQGEVQTAVPANTLVRVRRAASAPQFTHESAVCKVVLPTVSTWSYNPGTGEVTVNGQNFVEGDKVKVNGNLVNTDYINDAQLTGFYFGIFGSTVTSVSVVRSNVLPDINTVNQNVDNITVPSGQTVECHLYDRLTAITGTINFLNTTVPAGNLSLFRFTVTGPNNYSNIFDLTGNTNTTTTVNPSTKSIVVNPGTYSISWVPQISNWSSTSATCVNAATQVTVPLNSVVISASTATTINCTFVNDEVKITGLSYSTKVFGVNGPDLIITGTGFSPNVNLMVGFVSLMGQTPALYTRNSSTQITVSAANFVNTMPVGAHTFYVSNPGPYYGSSSYTSLATLTVTPPLIGYLGIIQVSRGGLGTFDFEDPRPGNNPDIAITTVDSGLGEGFLLGMKVNDVIEVPANVPFDLAQRRSGFQFDSAKCIVSEGIYSDTGTLLEPDPFANFTNAFRIRDIEIYPGETVSCYVYNYEQFDLTVKKEAQGGNGLFDINFHPATNQFSMQVTADAPFLDNLYSLPKTIVTPIDYHLEDDNTIKIKVQGGNFNSSDVIEIGALALQTTLEDDGTGSETLTAVLPSLAVGEYFITVVRPGPNGGTSNRMLLTVRDTLRDLPIITSVSPTWIAPGSPNTNVLVYALGTAVNADDNYVFYFNGVEVPSVTPPFGIGNFTLTIPASLLVNPGSFVIEAMNTRAQSIETFSILTQNGLGNTVADYVYPQSYGITEDSPQDWEKLSSDCSDYVNLLPGIDKICTLINKKTSPSGKLRVIQTSRGGVGTFDTRVRKEDQTQQQVFRGNIVTVDNGLGNGAILGVGNSPIIDVPPNTPLTIFSTIGNPPLSFDAGLCINVETQESVGAPTAIGVQGVSVPVGQTVECYLYSVLRGRVTVNKRNMNGEDSNVRAFVRPRTPEIPLRIISQIPQQGPPPIILDRIIVEKPAVPPSLPLNLPLIIERRNSITLPIDQGPLIIRAQGTNFTAADEIMYNGLALDTTLEGGELKATLPAGLSVGEDLITVTRPSVGNSNGLPLIVSDTLKAMPTIETIEPAWVNSGSSDTDVFITAYNVASSFIAYVNGDAVVTELVSTDAEGVSTFKATIPAEKLTGTGNMNVVLADTNPANQYTFDIATDDGLGSFTDYVYPQRLLAAEQPVEGYERQSSDCERIEARPGQDTGCEQRNVPTEKGYIKIIKKVIGGDLFNTFNFRISNNVEGYNTFVITNSITGDGPSLINTPLTPNSETNPGLYTITETVPPGWALTDATCDYNDPLPTIVGNNQLTRITVRPGRTTTCTLTNTKLSPTQGYLRLIKTSRGGEANFSVSVTVPGAGNSYVEPLATADSGASDSIVVGVKYGNVRAINAGTVTSILEQNLPAGWVYDITKCFVNGNSTGTAANNGITNVSIIPGQTTNCYIYNHKPNNTTVVKQAPGPNALFPIALKPKTNFFTVRISAEAPPVVLTEVINPYRIFPRDTAPVTLRVRGNFIEGDEIVFNGIPLATQFVGANELSAVLANPLDIRTRYITVQRPGPQGGTSDALPFFTIDTMREMAHIERISPSWIAPGSGATNIIVRGSNFTEFHLLRVNAGMDLIPLVTQFISPQELRATLPAAALVNAGSIGIDAYSINPNAGYNYNITTNNGTGSMTQPTYPHLYTPIEGLTPGWEPDSDEIPFLNVNALAGINTSATVFNRTNQKGYLKIVKRVIGGDLVNIFTFGVNGPTPYNTFAITNNATNQGESLVNPALNPGKYSIRELIPPGWDLAQNAICNQSAPGDNIIVNGDTISNITVKPGIVTTCQLLDYKLPVGRGSLEIIQTTIGGDGLFNYSVLGPAPSVATYLTAAQTVNALGVSQVNPFINPGKYKITQLVPVGFAVNANGSWCNNSAPNDDINAVDNTIDNITVLPNEVTTCYMQNYKITAGSGYLQIIKRTEKPVDNDTLFKFNIDPGN